MQQATAWIKVCTTCDRYHRVGGPRTLGQQLGDALQEALSSRGDSEFPAFRRIHCLAGCKNPGNVAIGSATRLKMRLHRLTLTDVPALVDLVERYLATPDGNVAEDDWPPSLRGRLAASVAIHRAHGSKHENHLNSAGGFEK